MCQFTVSMSAPVSMYHLIHMLRTLLEKLYVGGDKMWATISVTSNSLQDSSRFCSPCRTNEASAVVRSHDHTRCQLLNFLRSPVGAQTYLPSYSRNSHSLQWIGTEVGSNYRQLTQRFTLCLVGTIRHQTESSADTQASGPVGITLPTPRKGERADPIPTTTV